jgi:hypothetical protein
MQSTILYTIRKNNLFGFISETGQVIAEPLYEKAYAMSHGYGLIEENGLQGLIDYKGNILLNPMYNGVTILDKEIFGIKKKDKYALFALDGKQLCTFDYYTIFPFEEGLACAYKETGMGYLNKNGEEEIPFLFSYAESFQQNHAWVKMHNKYRFINRSGVFAQEACYDWYRKYEQGYIVNIGGSISDDECYGGKFGLLSMDGKEITAMIYDSLDGFFEGYSLVRQGKFFGAINEEGVLTAPIIFEQQVRFSEGLASVQKDYKYGYVNLDNQLIIKHQFRWAGIFRKGVANVALNDLEGFIDTKGKF